MHGRLTGARVIWPRLAHSALVPAAAVTAHLARADDIRAVLRGRSRSRARAPLGCPFCTPARCSRSARRGGLPSLPVTHRRAPDCGGAGTEAARKRRGFCAGDARRFAASERLRRPRRGRRAGAHDLSQRELEPFCAAARGAGSRSAWRRHARHLSATGAWRVRNRRGAARSAGSRIDSCAF